MMTRKAVSVLLALTVILSTLCSVVFTLSATADDIGAPTPAEDYEQKQVTVLENFLGNPGDNAFADWTKQDVTDIPNVPLAPGYKAKILQASSTTTNNDFQYISSTKKTGLPDDKTGLVFSVWVRYTPKSTLAEAPTQKIRLQFNESISNGSGGYAKGDNIYGDMTVTGDGQWHNVEINASDMTGYNKFDGIGNWTVIFTSLKGNSFVADDIIEFADFQIKRTEWVKKNGGLGANPGEDYETISSPAHTEFLNGPVSNSFSNASLKDISDIPGVKLAKGFYAKVLKASSTTAATEDMWRYISSTKKYGFTEDTKYWRLTFWTRYTPKAGLSENTKQNVRVSFVEAKADSTQASGYNKGDDTVYGDMWVVGDGVWHKVEFTMSDLVGGANLADSTGVWTMTFQSLLGNTFVADDVVEFANIQFEKNEWVLKNNGRGAYPGEDYEEGTKTVHTNFLNVPGSNTFATWTKYDVTDIPGVKLAPSYKADILVNSSTSGNNDFQYISSTTKEGLPDETRYLSLTLWARYNPKDQNAAKTQNIRIKVKEAVVDSNSSTGYSGADEVYGDFTVTGDGQWQKITIPVTDMVGGANLDGSGIWTVVYSSLKGNSFVAGDVIEFANLQFEQPVWVLKNGGLGAYPGEDYEEGYVTVLQDFLNLPDGNDFADITREVIGKLPDGLTAYNYVMKLKQNSSTDKNDGFRYISTTKKFGLPIVKDYMYFSFWVRYTTEADNTPTQTIRMDITEAVEKIGVSDEYEAGDKIYGDFTVTGNGEWTKVEIPISDMVGAANFDGVGVWTVVLNSLKGNTFKVGDKLEIAGFEVRKPAWVLKNDGMGAAPSEDHMIGQEIYWNNNATLIQRIVKESLSMKHEIVSIDEPSIDSTKAYKTTFGDAADFNEHKLYYMFYPDAPNVNEGIDMSEAMDEMRVGFWFKTPEGRDNMTFRLVLFDNKWVGYLNKDFVIEKGGEWTYVEVKFSDMTPYREIVADNMGRMEIRLVDTENGLADGESLYITDIRMFTRKWVLKPDLYEDNLSKYQNPYKTESNVLFAHTIDDYESVEGNAKAAKVDAKNGEYFDFATEITTTDAADKGNWYVTLEGDTVNLLDVYETAALRLFLKSPKENVRVVVGLVDKYGNKLTTNVLIEEKNAWQEVQIRPSKIKATGFDRTAITGVVIGSEYKATHSEKYLAKGQSLLVGGIEIYDNSPTRKLAEKVYTQTIAEAIDSNFLLVPGSFGTTIDVRPDYLNLMNKKSTWQIYLRRESKKGISIGIPLPQEWDLSKFKDFGFISFSIASNRYTSINLEITDGENTYKQDITAAEDWMEYRVYFHDIAAAGVNTSKIEEITMVRNRTIGEGCVINVTEFTACGDLYNIEYLSESIKEDTTPPTVTPEEPQEDTETLPELPQEDNTVEDITDFEDTSSEEPQEDTEEVEEPDEVKPPKKDTSSKKTDTDNSWVFYVIGAAVLIACAAAASVLIIRKRKAKN